jgi:RNA polymerase sigma-70 factor (ECF subfamily)
MFRLFSGWRGYRADEPAQQVSADEGAGIAFDAGDSEGVRRLLGAVGPSMLRSIRRVLGPNYPDVEDVFQEAAFGLLGAMRSFRAESSLSHFASRVAVLTALSARRRLRSTPAGEAGTRVDVEAANSRASAGFR